jgi:hypothetical protein
MYGNSRFRQASKAETPQFAAAAGRQGQLDNAAQMQENSQLSNNVMGAGALYNEGMGDKSPLYDLMAEAFGPEETINALRSGMEGVDLGAGGELTESGMAAMEAQNQGYYAQQAAQEEAARKAAELAAQNAII